MKATNNQIQEDKKRFLRLLNKAGFKNIKAFSDSEEIDLKYSAISKWGTEKDKAENLRPFPKWVFSWLNLYIENMMLEIYLKNLTYLLNVLDYVQLHFQKYRE